MTHMFKKQSSSSMLTQTTTSTSGALAMHRDSRVITKVQPKIRIIHIFAPEIIKTDVANFRELVQRLTGKPDAGGSKGKDKGKGKKVKPETARPGCNNNNSSNNNNISTKLDIMVGSGSSSSPSSSSDHQNHDHHHNNQEAWRLNGGDHIINNNNNNNHNSSGGYLTGFTDLDYSFDFNNLFHLGAADGSSHLNSIAENTQLSYRG